MDHIDDAVRFVYNYHEQDLNIVFIYAGEHYLQRTHCGNHFYFLYCEYLQFMLLEKMEKYEIEAATLILFYNDWSTSETELLNYYKYLEETTKTDDIKDPSHDDSQLRIINLRTSAESEDATNAESESSEESESSTINLGFQEKRPTKINLRSEVPNVYEECSTGEVSIFVLLFKNFIQIIMKIRLSQKKLLSFSKICFDLR